MGPGFKYHVVTVAAVFFALTIGLVVGTLYVSPRAANRQAMAIESLKLTLDDEVKKLQPYQEYAARVTPALMSGRLRGAGAAIIQTGDYPEAAEEVRAALTDAGAVVRSQITIERAFDRPDEVLNPALESAHADDSSLPTTRKEIVTALATALATGDAQSSGITASLENARLMRYSQDSDFSLAVQYVVIVVGSRLQDPIRAATVDKPLITALQAEHLRVVACEPENAAVSDVKTYRSLNIDVSTVDDVDSVIGEYSLVNSLAGEDAVDDYGVKDTANQLLPQVATTSR